MYSSSKEWLSHMRSEHRMSWRCVVKDHPPQTFETCEAFLKHMTEAHSRKFRKEQLPFIAESSARVLRPTVTACPFCAEGSGDLENHVAQHLCHFALQSLPWPDHLDQTSEIISGWKTYSSASEDVERATLKDDLTDTLKFSDDEWIRLLDPGPDSSLDLPVSWPNIGRTFPEPDPVLSDFAAHAARRATMAPDDIHRETDALDEELRQVREQLPDIVSIDADMDTRLLRASLRGPWGFEGKHIMLNVKVAVPHSYPGTQAPIFMVEGDGQMPTFVREMLQREVDEICQLHLQRDETCLAAAFSYLLGLRNLTSSIDMFNIERGHTVPLGDVDEGKPLAFPVSQLDGKKSAKVADNNEPTIPEKNEAQQKSGYLNKRGKISGAWKSRFYVVEGPQLKCYDAAGGAQLRSIQLQGAQIGKQVESLEYASSAADTKFNHALLILEPNKGSKIRHILCAENDEERDLWVEALLPWIGYADSNEEAKTAENDRPRVSESQTDSPQSPTFLAVVCEKSGQFCHVDHSAPYVTISSAAIASCPIDCQLNLSKTEFGILDGRPGGIIYLDIAIGTPHSNLQSVAITVIVDHADPDLKRVVWSAEASDNDNWGMPVVLSNIYEPKFMVLGAKRMRSQFSDLGFRPEAEAMGAGLGGIGARQKKTRSSGGAWRITGQRPTSSKSPPSCSIRWNISSDLESSSLQPRSIHTGFVVQGGVQPFSLKIEIEGKSSKFSDRFRQTSNHLRRANLNSTKRGKILLNWSEGHLSRRLDGLAWALPEAMVRENKLQGPPNYLGTGPGFKGTEKHALPTSSSPEPARGRGVFV